LALSNLVEINGRADWNLAGDSLKRGWSTAAGKKKGRKAGDSMSLHAVAFDGVLCPQKHRSLNWHMLVQRCEVEQKIQRKQRCNWS
jgi:hypothetical protein